MRKSELMTALRQERQYNDWLSADFDFRTTQLREARAANALVRDALAQCEDELRQARLPSNCERITQMMDLSVTSELLEQGRVNLECLFPPIVTFNPTRGERLTLNVRDQPIASWVDGEFEEWKVQT